MNYQRLGKFFDWFCITGLVMACTAVLCIGVAMVVYGIAKDDTDPPDGRSGMHLYTDARTGCMYLSRGDSLTPRMGADGKQICEAKK